MSTTDRTLLAAFLAGNVTEAHKAAPPAHFADYSFAVQEEHNAASENERIRWSWALAMITAADARNRQRAAACSSNPGSADRAEKIRTQADDYDKRASEWLSAAIAQGAFDDWTIPAAM